MNDAAKRKKNEHGNALRILLIVALLFVSYYSFAEAYTIGPNYRNISIDTRANITNAQPEILNITLEDPVTLNAGTTYPVSCNISVRDWNGAATIDTVNATYFHSTSSLNAADDNNTHYTNSSCTQTGIDGFLANYTCTFDVYYYALPNEWNCTVFANDTNSFVGNGTTNGSINELLALNVTNPIDYGDLAINDFSTDQTANVTNFGNVPINVSVYGFGNTTGDGLAMVCDQGNITVDNQRYATSPAIPYASKTSLTSSGVQLENLTIGKQTLPTTEITNTTYWQLFVPPNPFGQCNGTVVFQAESST
jgi:hypothetical protein